MIVKTSLVPKAMIDFLFREIASAQLFINGKLQSTQHLSQSYLEVKYGEGYASMSLRNPLIFTVRNNGTFKILFTNYNSDPLFILSGVDNFVFTGNTLKIEGIIVRIGDL